MTIQTEAPSPKSIKVIKFGGLSCPACLAMNKAKTLDRLAEDFPIVDVISLDVNDADGETPKGSKFDENYALSDEYEVDTLPTIIFEDAESGDELNRVEGAVSFKDLRKVLDGAIEEREAIARRKSASKRVRK
jgi:thiol-disulfide isomerase/thioredoxin